MTCSSGRGPRSLVQSSSALTRSWSATCRITRPQSASPRALSSDRVSARSQFTLPNSRHEVDSRANPGRHHATQVSSSRSWYSSPFPDGMLVTLPASAATAQSGTWQTPVVSALLAPNASVAAPPDYVIGADDVLSIVFWKASEISGHVRVRPDGKISLPLLGEVSGAGLTPESLRQQLETRAGPFFADIIATVMVDEINSRRVFVTGAVGRPGAFPLNGRV